jgi:4-alpha-glucanotransferase
MGACAFKWIDFLVNAGVRNWQILPVNPTGYGNSPYQGLSAFAGHPLFIDLDDLVLTGLISHSQTENAPRFPDQKVDFGRVNAWKNKILVMAFERFSSGESSSLHSDFEMFCDDNRSWLDDFAVFMSLRGEHQLKSWSEWPEPFKRRERSALRTYQKQNSIKLQYHRFLQFIFARQWKELKSYANSKGVQIIGDIPIYVGMNCADVWAQPQLFQLDVDRQPTAVAGVPPDFFSESGQLWGNPLYDWDAHRMDGYRWWKRRIQRTLEMVDLIRLDHFRGFAGYYSIPASAKTAADGDWIQGPGANFFSAIKKELQGLPFIAEDLGVITPDVEALRDQFDLPGMKILQFAFGSDASHAYLPHNYPANCVAYTGTHDNNTTKGWYQEASAHEKAFCARYLGGHVSSISREMIRILWQSPAKLTISPLQDFLQLGAMARMNTPSTVGKNWTWRVKPDALTEDLSSWIREINTTYNR